MNDYPEWVRPEERDAWDQASDHDKEVWQQHYEEAFERDIAIVREADHGTVGEAELEFRRSLARNAARRLMQDFVKHARTGRVHPNLLMYMADRIEDVLEADKRTDRRRADGFIPALKLHGRAYVKEERDKFIATYLCFSDDGRERKELLYEGLLVELEKAGLAENDWTADDVREYVNKLKKRKPSLFCS